MSLIDVFLDEEAAITPRKEVYIAIRTDGATGTGAIDDPYNGSTYTLLDNLLLNIITADTTIRFGPGIFQTAGNGGFNSIWAILNRQKVIGAGMFQTTVQVVHAVPITPVAAPIFAFGSVQAVDGVEISDLTIDANLSRQPLSGGVKNDRLTVGGISLAGTNLKVRRVRIINWGTYNKDKEAFPIFLTGFATVDGGVTRTTGENVVETCMLEQPDLSQRREVTMLNNHAHYDYPDILSTVRHNYLNGDYTTGAPPAPIELLSVQDTSPTVTFKTKWPHRLVAKDATPGISFGDEVYISGAASNPNYNGRHAVTSADDFCTFTISKGSLGAVPTDSGITIQRYVPQAMIVSSVTHIGAIARVTTPVPHLRKPGDYIRISGAALNGSTNNLYNGAFAVLSSGLNSTQFEYEMDSTPSPNQDPSGESLIWLDRWPSQSIIIRAEMESGSPTGLKYLTNDGTNVYAMVKTRAPHYRAPGDYVRLADIPKQGIPLTDSPWNGFFQVIHWPLDAYGKQTSRRFKIRIPGRTSMPSLVENDFQTEQISQTFQALSATQGYGRVFGNRAVDVRTAGPYHDLTEGDPKRTKDLLVFQNYYYFVYIGQFSNLAASFTPENPGDNREGRDITYDNIIELQPYAADTWNQSPPGGILFWAPASNFPEFESLLARDNLIRFYGGTLEAPGENGYAQYGIDARIFRDLIVEDNVIAFGEAIAPLTFQNMSGVPYASKYFNNTGLNGKFLQGGQTISPSPIPVHYIDEIQSLAEDVVWVWRDQRKLP